MRNCFEDNSSSQLKREGKNPYRRTNHINAANVQKVHISRCRSRRARLALGKYGGGDESSILLSEK